MDEAAEAHPDSFWWIKGDACDITKGLGESVTQKWSGDVDLDDGELQKQYNNYQQRLHFIKGIGLPPRHERPLIIVDLKLVKEQLKEDVAFILKGLFFYVHMCTCI